MTALDLATDETFLQRVALAYASVAHAVLTTPDPAPPDAVRLKQLEAVRRLGSVGQVRTLAGDSLALVLGSPEVLTAIATNTTVADADLLTVCERILDAYTEYAALGGTL